MRITLPPLEIDEKKPFNPTTDLFNRKPFAVSLTNLVSRIEEPLVVALDGEWGTGKTTFLKMWEAQLKLEGFPVIFFDAFENDYIDDAFAVLAREIVAFSKDNLESESFESIKKGAIETLKTVGKGTAKALINFGISTATGGLANYERAAKIVEDAASEFSDISDQYIDEFFEKADANKKTIEAFKTTLSEIAPKYAKKQKLNEPKPLIFIIDELDRCRPDFSLKIIERIKHFFSVKNVHFVFGVNLIQLENSVKAVYGSDIDARLYLQKFITLYQNQFEYQETKGNNDKLVKYADHVEKSLFKDDEIKKDSFLPYAKREIVRYLKMKNPSLRSVEKIYSHLSLINAIASEKYRQIQVLIADLLILKLYDFNTYKNIKNHTAKFSDVLEKLALNKNNKKPEEDNSRQISYTFWKIILNENENFESKYIDTIRIILKSNFDYPTIYGNNHWALLDEIINDVIEGIIPSDTL